jgi:16S rRNA (uracil1498-N3)-methyltransferase
MSLVRLFLNEININQDQRIEVTGNDFDYLIKVMRHKLDDEILIFNGNDGEFCAKITQINKKNCQITLTKQTKKQQSSSNITLAFAPVKNVRIDFIAAKATEMGVNKFQPIITHHSVVDKLNENRFQSNCKEAAEQCQRLDIPSLTKITKLNSYLKKLNSDQILILCDESIESQKASKILSQLPRHNNPEIIIFIGPEGGFSKEEFKTFYQIKNLTKISLGPRILRTDTAIISSLSLINEYLVS